MGRRSLAAVAVLAVLLALVIALRSGDDADEARKPDRPEPEKRETHETEETAGLPARNTGQEPPVGNDAETGSEPEPGAERVLPRILWKLETAGRTDRFYQIVPAGDRVVAVRGKVLRALDAATGEVLWRYPETGAAFAWPERATARPLVFVLGVGGGLVYTRFPANLLNAMKGVRAISLEDGVVVNEYELHGRFGGVGGLREPARAPLAAFVSIAQEPWRSEIIMMDLSNWSEKARIIVPGRVDLHRGVAVGPDRVGGILSRTGKRFGGAFIADIGNGKLYTLPIRGGSTSWQKTPILPDGGLLTGGGRLGPTCAYERPWPWMRRTCVAGGGVYLRDRLGLCRTDPKDGRELWRIDLGFREGRSHVVRIAATEDAVIVVERDGVLIADARTGEVHAFLPTPETAEVEESLFLRDVEVVCDGDRAYVASGRGLTALALRPPIPGKPGMEGPCDPASAISRCRKSLIEDDLKGALEALVGIGRKVATRPEARGEAGELLSQISRLKPGVSHPSLWARVQRREGWVAGELFLAEVAADAKNEPDATAALLLMGTERALRKAAATLDTSVYDRDIVELAATARERLEGRWPYGELIARKSTSCLFRRTPDDETCRRVLKLVKGWELDKFLRLEDMRPDLVVAYFQGMKLRPGSREDTALKVAEAQIESSRRGSGELEEIEVLKADELVPPEDVLPEDEF